MEFELVIKSWRPDIIEVMQSARRLETPDANTAKVTTSGLEGLEVTTTMTAAEWDKANKNLYTLLYLTVGRH